MLRLAVKDIMSRQPGGALLGAVAYADTFLEVGNAEIVGYDGLSCAAFIIGLDINTSLNPTHIVMHIFVSFRIPLCILGPCLR